MPDANPSITQQKQMLAKARATAMESLALASQALANVSQLLQEIEKQEAALRARQSAPALCGGIDQPGLDPVKQREVAFEVYRHDIRRWTGGIPVLGAPRAAKAWIDVLNEQHASKPQLRN